MKGGICRKMKKAISKIFKSKLTVLFVILVVWIVGSQVIGEAAGYKAGTAYQYYLLGEKSEHITEESENAKFLKLGSLGSGGVSGEFSYDDIVNSASEDDKNEAERFASIMATYSTFNYFSNKVEGFASILSYVGRAVALIILLPLALIMDTLNLLIDALLGIIAKVNVIPMLASALTDLDIASDLAGYLGITEATISTITSSLLSFAVAMILISLAGMFRSRGRIDQGSYSKLKGRIFSVLAMPLIIGIGATLLDNFHDLASESDNFQGNFSRYMVDSRAWAYNFNFAPNGDNGRDGNIKPSSDSSYVDLNYNPYTTLGALRIKRINSQSSLAGNDEDNVFPNTALVLSYGTSESFSAIDFINYKGTAASKSYYGRDDGDGKSFGSYYDYAQTMAENGKLQDVNRSYYPSGGDRVDDDAVGGGYKEAIDDYVSGDTLMVSPQIAWRDRFIYGAKSSGDNIDNYYSEPPSIEQMENEVGTNDEAAFSNQSMFLILSTMFNETGGKYYIDAPSRGILQAKAAFDSNRSTYFVVSMVGSPWLTIFGLIAKPIIQLVIMCAIVFAILSMGIIDMNLRPLMAWLKGITLGNIEYSQALIIYCIGIGGTILTLIAVPQLLGAGIEALSKLVVVPAEMRDLEAISPQASIALKGTPLIITALLSLVFAFLFFKSPTFRKSIIELFTMPWAWAKSTGERLEMQASGGAGMRMKTESDRMIQRNGLNQALNFSNLAHGGAGAGGSTSVFGKAANWVKNTASGVKEDLNLPSSNLATGQNETGSAGLDGMKSKKVQSAGTVAKNGMYERAVNSLRENEVDRDVSDKVRIASIEAQEGIMQFHKMPTQENYIAAHDKLDLLENEIKLDEGSGADSEARLSKARAELFNLAKSHGVGAFENPSIDIVDKTDKANKIDNLLGSLKEIELDHEVSNSVQIASVDAQNAISDFKEMPTQETFVEAQNELNVLHSKIVDGGYGEGKAAQVIQAKQELQALSESHNLISVENPTEVINQNAVYERTLDGLKDYEIEFNNEGTK